MLKNDRCSLINRESEYVNKPFVWLKIGSPIDTNQDKNELIDFNASVSQSLWMEHSLSPLTQCFADSMDTICDCDCVFNLADSCIIGWHVCVCLYIRWFEWFAQYECHESNSLSTRNLLSIIHILWCNAVHKHRHWRSNWLNNWCTVWNAPFFVKS